MNKFFLPIFCSLLSCPTFAQNFEWAASTGGPSTDHATTVIADPVDGSIYVSGFFFDSFDADPGVGNTNFTAVDAMDLFLSKLSSAGDLIWAEHLGGTGLQKGMDLAIDSQQNIHVLSTNESSMDIHKFDTNGNLLWTYATDYGDGFWPYALTVDNNNDVYFCGTYSDTVDFDNSLNTDYLIAPGAEAGFITKIDSNGDYLWAQSYGTVSGGAIFSDITIASDQQIYATGFFHGPIDFDPGIGNYTLSSFGSTDIFTLKLDANANFEWVAQSGGTDSNQSRNIAVDTDGNSYMTGFFEGTIDADPSGASHNLTAVGSSDFMVQKLDVDGNLEWAHSFGGVGYDIPEGISVDDEGYTYITGNFGETADFDPTIGVYDLDAGVMDDGFILKLNPIGELTWAYQIVGDWFNTGFDICLDNNQNIITVGSFENDTDLNPLGGNDTHSTAGFADMFVLKLSQPTAATLDEAANSLRLYPIPASDMLYLSANWLGDYTIITMEGKIAQSGTINGDSIPLTELEQGVYVLKLSSSEKELSRRLIIE